ncbi:MAG TPA: iron-containing alcohol dehydrogenase [Methylomusa anaerophila]|uniref:Alcohol dehydrogenase 2 n=1 Tax=Methylomusa anaerophila TaxID=1930071 RepID=A0A348AK85_9FIRM|nr:iron-containing alcohol dehydrogenase [Methylomusa anaerophila]BBB91483.1 alcohol dehydrogenase 2 [Methylomusa anaerophila]HML89928.1 iron-containing alcohol dehydrogenase [Methylomusa anaerophila]
MENTHNFLTPKANLIGVGAIKDLPNELLGWKLSKALIVTDRNLVTLGWVEQIEKILKNVFISYDIFDGVLHSNPTVGFVEDGLSYFPHLLELKRDYSLIISVGGGTCHDCAKAIAVVATNGGSIIDYEGYNKVTKPGIPHIAVNTTSGSAAEMTMLAIITDESRKVKMPILSPNLTPLMSVNDPMFMVTMPPEVTASTGTDVLSHAVEAYLSTEASPITDSLALTSIKLVFNYLRRAYENGNDMEAREQMVFASVMAGMAFNNAGLGLIHAMTHQLGGFYNLFHGDYNSVLLPYVLDYNAVSVPADRLLKMAEAMGEKAASQPEAVEKIMNAFRKLAVDLKIPAELRKMGVRETDIPQLSQNAFKDISTFTNPRRSTLEDIENIYRASMGPADDKPPHNESKKIEVLSAAGKR